MKKTEIQDELKKTLLSANGLKDDLAQRLFEALGKESSNVQQSENSDNDVRTILV